MWPKKIFRTYSSSDAAAREPKERVQYHFIILHTSCCNKSLIKNVVDLEWPKSSVKSLNTEWFLNIPWHPCGLSIVPSKYKFLNNSFLQRHKSVSNAACDARYTGARNASKRNLASRRESRFALLSRTDWPSMDTYRLLYIMFLFPPLELSALMLQFSQYNARSPPKESLTWLIIQTVFVL